MIFYASDGVNGHVWCDKPCHTTPYGTRPYVGYFKLCPRCAAQQACTPEQWLCNICYRAVSDDAAVCTHPHLIGGGRCFGVRP